MLAGLFSKAWQSSSSEKRHRWVLQADKANPTKQATLLILAKQDNNVNVRHAAIDKLTSALQIFELSNSHKEKETQQYATLALAELIGMKSNITEQECRDLLAKDSQLNIAMAKYCPHSDLRHELLEKFSEQQQSQIISDVTFTDTRQLIAQNLVSIEALEIAKKSLKGKDKNAEKIIKAKLDIHQKTEKQNSDNKKLAEELCTKMEFLANHEKWRPEFKSQYLLCEQQWTAKNFMPDASVISRYESAKKIVATDVQRRTDIDNAVQIQNQCIAELKINGNKLSQHSIEEALKNKNIYSSTLDDIQQKWQQSLDIYSADSKLTQEFNTSRQGIQSAIDFFTTIENSKNFDNEEKINDKENIIQQFKKALGTLSWPAVFPKLTARTDIENQLAELLKISQESRATQKKNLDKLHQRINRLVGNTKRGNLSVARRELNAVKNAAEGYTGKDKNILDDRIEQAKQAVQKMSDWQDFATEPKYIALCDDMEELGKSEQHPDKLAKSIKALQKKWKDLGHSESADKHWDRFKAAADSAYEPCSVFFEQRYATRVENLKKREPFLEQARSLLENTNWEDEPDFKKIETEIRNISNEWQKVKDVEPKLGREQWQTFSKYKSAIYEKLDVVYDANLRLKEQLIKQTLGMLDNDIQEQSLTKLQHLQSKWKQIGITRRKQDQVVWKKFNAASDEVYAKIKSLRNDKRAKEDEQLNAYRSVIKKINELAKNATSLPDGDPKFEELQVVYNALPDLPINLPEKLTKGIKNDFNRSIEAYSKTRKKIQQSNDAKVLDAVYQYAELCEQLEALDINSATEKTSTIKTKMNDIVISDKKIHQRLQQRIDKSLDNDREQFALTRKEICINIEILLDVDSPNEDRSQRMEMQLTRLKTKGIANDNNSLENKVNEFEIDWLCLPGAETEQQKLLNQRFNSLIELVKKRK